MTPLRRAEESYDFEYAVMEQADKNSNTHFEFETYDTYQWYLDFRSALEYQRQVSLTAKFLTGTPRIDHPDYDDFWKKKLGCGSFTHQLFRT